jgi:hypothetical protein
MYRKKGDVLTFYRNVFLFLYVKTFDEVMNLDEELFEAVKKGDTEKVKEFLSKGINTDLRDKEGFSHYTMPLFTTERILLRY